MSHSPLSISPTKIRRQSQLISEPKQYNNNEIQDLLESEALSGSEKDLILRVYEAAEKLRIWCQEIDEWGWTGSFEDTGMRDEPLDDSDFSVEHESLWEKREERLNSIASALERMELDELKARVWRMHSQNASHERYRSDEQDERPVAMYSDFELFATQMIVQTLPDLEILRHALRSWSLRLIVFQEMDAYFQGLEETRQWRKEANLYISADHMQEIDVRSIDEMMTGLDVCRTNLEKQIAELGVQLDKMLDALETSDDTLPEDWIDEFEDLEHFYGDWVAQAEAKLLEFQVRKVKLEKLQQVEEARRAKEMADNGDQEDRFTAIEQRLESVAPDLDQHYAANFTPRIVSPANILDTSRSSHSDRMTRVGSGLSSTPSIARAASTDRTSSASAYHEQYDGASDTSVDATFRRYSLPDDAESFKLGQLDFEGDDHEFSFMLPEDHFEVDLSDLDDDFDYSTLLDSPASSEPGSPVGGWDDTPSIPRIRPIAKAPVPPLNALVTKRRSIDQNSLAPFQDINAAPSSPSKHPHHLTPVRPPTKRIVNRSGRANKSPSLPFQEHLSELVNSLPTPIHLVTSRADSLSPISTTHKHHDQISNAIRTPHDRVPSLLRAFENARSTPPSAAQALPALTLTAVETRRRTKGPSDIRIYHLSAPGKDKPIKLFIRRIGENNERLMVRVGGGWADLGEYLRAYAAHHLSSMGMDVRDLEQSKPDSTQANGKHQRDISSSSTTASADETSSTHTNEPSELRSELIDASTSKDSHNTIQFTPDLTQRSQTPTSLNDSYRRITPYSNEQVSLKPVSLAGPVAFKRAQKQEMNTEKKEWVEGIVEQARRTVSGSYPQNNASNISRNTRAATPLGRSSPAMGHRDSAERPSSRLSGQFRRLSIEGAHGEKSKKLWLRTKE